MHFYIEHNNTKHVFALFDRKFGTGYRKIIAWV